MPDGYGENGIWVRGEHDYAEPRVAGAIGTGIWSTMIARVGEATWVERRNAFVDARRQVAKVRAENSRSLSGGAIERWRDIEEEACFRFVSWIGARGLDGPRPRAAAADASAMLVRGRDRDGEGQTHRVARGRFARRRRAHDEPGDRALA